MVHHGCLGHSERKSKYILACTTRSATDFRNSIDSADDYASYGVQVISLLKTFQATYKRHFGRMTSATKKVDLEPSAAKPIHSETYRAGLNARNFTKNKIDRILYGNVIDPTQTKWASFVMSTRRKDGTLWLCANYHKSLTGTARDFYPLPRIARHIAYLENSEVFSELHVDSRFWKEKLKSLIEKRPHIFHITDHTNSRKGRLN